MKCFVVLLGFISVLISAKSPVIQIRNKRDYDKMMAHANLLGLPVAVDFYSDSCGPCRMIAPRYKALAEQYNGKAIFLKVDTHQNREVGYDVRSLPTFRFFLNGKKKKEFSGADENGIRRTVQELISSAKRRKSHILPISSVSVFKKTLSNAMSVPVVAAFVSKSSEACQKVWPDIKKKAKSSFGKAVFIKIDVDQNEKTQELAGVTSIPTVHMYIKGKKQDQVIGAFTSKEFEQAMESTFRKARDAKSSKKRGEKKSDCEECPELPDHTPRRPDRRNRLRLISKKPEKVVVIGAGPAGLSAALYCARAGLEPLVIAPAFGGQLSYTKEVENFPTLVDGTGPGLVDKLRFQAEHFGTQFENTVVTNVDLDARPFVLTTNQTENEVIKTHALIVATGSNSRWLGVEGEELYRAKGVSTCAVCDGYLFQGMPVVVVGGGDSAMEEAMFLARIASSVTLVHRRDTFRASHILQQRVLQSDKINILWNSEVTAFEGDEVMLTHVAIRNKISGEEIKLKVDATFIAIGHDPNTALFKDQLELDSHGYLVLNRTSHGFTLTNVEGVFAAGDVADNMYRQAVTSAGTGAMAALDAERWLNEYGADDEDDVEGKYTVDLSGWSSKELKSAIKELGLSSKGCLEKADFISVLMGAM